MRNTHAIFLLVFCCLLSACGKKLTPEEQAAVAWENLQARAERGDAKAQLKLGIKCQLEGNHAEAEAWYKKAADQGHPDGQYNLAAHLWMEPGVDNKAGELFAKAAEGYLAAARQGNVRAQYYLGDMYSSATGVEQDFTQAIFWLRKAADQGNADAQLKIGALYEEGWEGYGYPQDYALAADWYRKSAEQGNAAAQEILADMYDFGQGVAQDKEQALAWREKAREKKVNFFQFFPIHDMEPDSSLKMPGEEVPNVMDVIKEMNKLDGASEGAQE
ncbi:MAG: sel1 repeat family protein [Methylobacillus sp.]|nr:sel1 repeat family protein [Methylobacillus sp.]